jgi:branched-subunit amino acid ABC-type transport system permease component
MPRRVRQLTPAHRAPRGAAREEVVRDLLPRTLGAPMIVVGTITTSLVLVNLVDAWLYGSLLAAVAVSLTLVFGLGRVVNFAIGTFYALGAYCAYAFRGPLGYWPAIVCAMLAVALFAGGIERLAIRPLRGRTEISTLLATFGLTILLDGLIQVVWGTSTFTMPAPVGGSLSIAGQSMSVFIFVAAALASALCAGVFALLRLTPAGMVLRGASQNSSMAELLGVDTRALMTRLFAASAGIAALVGGFAGPIFSVRPGMDVDFLIDAFLAVVIGGLGSVRGAIVGAYIVALADNFALTFMTGDIATAVSFVFVIAILLARPQGIFGEGRVIG